MNGKKFYISYGTWLCNHKKNIHPADMDYSCIEYYQKSYENETDPIKKENTLNTILETTAQRDFFIGSLRQINHLFQIDPEPNRDFTEAKWEMYKISINFRPGGKWLSSFKLRPKSISNSVLVKDIAALRGTSNRVLFQNVEGNINMGVWFNDPDVEMEEICWYNLLAKTMYNNKVEKPELISVDYKLGAISCYVELHRNGNEQSFSNTI